MTVGTSGGGGPGYVTDIDYLCHFGPRQSPEWLNLVALVGGRAPPDRTDGYRWCELGCGRGITAIVNAALRPAGRFTAIDLMPSHIDFAREVAGAAGAGNLDLIAADFSAAGDLVEGPFDYLVAHGVYSWIDAAARADLHAFVDRHLAPGGLFYLSYNAMPGWATDAPAQHLLRALAAHEEGTSARRAAVAGARLPPLSGSGALSRSPIARDWQSYSAVRHDAYLAHEFLASHWRAFYVDEVRAALAEIGLAPVGSAVLHENFDRFMLRDDQRAALEPYDGDRRELVRDFLIDQRFRCDVFERQAKPLDQDAVRERLVGLPFALLRPPELIDYRFDSGPRQISFDNPVSRAIVGHLDRAPAPPGAGVQFELRDLAANTLSLASAGVIGPALASPADSTRLNQALRRLTRDDDGAGLIALPCGTALGFSGDFLNGDTPSAWRSFLRSQGAAP